jgi:hypothetical protein
MARLASLGDWGGMGKRVLNADRVEALFYPDKFDNVFYPGI